MSDYSNIQAESLLLKFKQELQDWNLRAKAVQDEQYEIYKIKGMAQDVCTHPTTREEDVYNYHNREDWTNVICTVCDKQVKRY